ncbi:amino acid adenylation domain-containing protein [Streptomyces sp. NPDC002466]|uniref:amino acid adenylation domain-containing protein n=1 Tax=Streptomyces sp. NPDC002466 TaxID=3364646 RepID=UPI0036AF53A5
MTDTTLDQNKLLDYLKRVTAELHSTRQKLQEATAAAPAPVEPVAVVGMGCRYPGGAHSPDALWDIVAEGRDVIGGFPTDRGWDDSGSYPRAGGFLYGAAEFDAPFFGITPREALAMDPQQRLLLESAWEALERAAIRPATLRSSATGVFVGATAGGYGPHAGSAVETVRGHLLTGAAPSVMSGRLAYFFGLEGPAVTMDTACSSSLSAIHYAVQALRSGQCGLALAGGVTVLATSDAFSELSAQGGLSSDGRCRTFAAAADGTGFSEGAGMLVLERLSDARRNGHPVLALVRGTAVNQDGASNGLSAPSGRAQQKVIRQALADAGLTSADIDLVEAHGTATRLGDPIEAQALLATYGRDRGGRGPLWLGSIKSNIGHTQAAAGVAGVIKTVQALRHGVMPGTLHVDEPTPRVEWASGEVELLTEARPWEARGAVRRAGISAFGISGTNAHVIIEEAPAEEPAGAPEERPSGAGGTGRARAVVLSARDEGALREQAGAWSRWLREHPGTPVADVAFTAARARTHFPVRANVVAEDSAALAGALAALADGSSHPDVAVGQARSRGKVVFVYPGQGSQWVGMGRELLESNEVFAASVDACDAALLPFTGWSVRAVLTGEAGDNPPFDRADVIQPVLFTMGIALSELWRSLGVEPAAVVGHSQGEVMAAVVSGALTLEQGAQVIAQRSRTALTHADRGGMALIGRPVAVVEELIAPYGDDLSVAAVNSAASTVVSGRVDAIERIVAELQERDVYARRINADYASHSAQMDPVLPVLAAQFKNLAPRRADIAFYSTVTGEVSDGTDLDGTYWCRNLREPVRLDRALDRLLDDGHTVFVEISAHPVLSMPLTDGSAERGGIVVGSLARDHGTTAQLLRNLGLLHVQGHTVDWERCTDGRLADLPTYAFQHKRYWLAPAADAVDAGALGLDEPGHPWLGAATELADEQGTLLTGRVSQTAQPWLAEHIVFDSALVPGTGLLDLALAAAHHVGADRVEEMTLLEPMCLPESGELRVQVAVGPADGAGRRRLTVHGRPSGTPGPWSRHAEGTLGAGPVSDAGPVDGFAGLREWPVPGAGQVDLDGIYDRMDGTGVMYGPAFRGLVGMWRDGDTLYGRVRLPEGVAAEGFGAHPALMDAALHVLGIARNEEDPRAPVLVPFVWSDVRLLAGGSDELRVRIDLDPAAGALRLWAVSADGAPVVTGDLQLREITAEQVNGARPVEHLYRMEYQPVRARGTADGRARTVVDARGWSGTVGEVAARGLVELQRLLAGPPSTELVWVTRGAVGADADDPAQATLWGLVRSARSEHPERTFRLVDTDAPSDERLDGAAFEAVLAVADEPELVVRAGRTSAPRLVPVTGPAAGAVRTLDPEGTVLVTGGTGELGRSLARHLVREHGARRLVLTSRRGPEAAGADALVADLTAAGAVDVRVVACDAGRREELAAVLATAPERHPWTGVFHLAAALDDGLLDAQTPERLAGVLAAKTEGALHLHELTRGFDLAVFALYSSVSGLVGGPGQSTYAAANTALDALATYRRSLGLPGISLSWGLWEQDGTGVTSNLTRADLARIERQGFGAFSTARALSALDAALCREHAHVVPVALDVPGLRRAAEESGVVPALLRGLLRAFRPRAAAAVAAPVREADLRERLAALPAPERLRALSELVCGETGVVIGLAAGDELDEQQSLKDLGLDSLMAVELRRRLSAAVDAVLPTDLAFSHPTPYAIAEYLMDVLGGGTAAEGAGSAGPVIPLERAERRDEHPATEGQKRLWFLEQLDPGSAQYNVALRARVVRPLDPDVLARALAWAGERHEALRTGLEMRADRLVQVVRETSAIPLVHEDLSGAGRDAVDARVRHEETLPVDLGGPSPVRCLLLDVSADEQLLCLTMHHAVVDGWSTGLLMREVAAACEAFAEGREPAAPEIVHQLGDYARWEARSIAEGGFDEGLRFFEEQLSGVPRLEFPPGPDEVPEGTEGGDRLHFRLPAEVCEAVERLAAERKVTPYAVYVSALSVLLARHCDQYDFGLATIWANREPEVTDTVGFLANTLPLRCDLTGDPTFDELIESMAPRVRGTMEHQAVPLTEVVRVASGERVDGETPFFRAGFNYLTESIVEGTGAKQNKERGADDAWLLPVSESFSGNVRGTAKFDLHVMLVAGDDGSGRTGLLGEIEFRPQVVGRPAAGRLVAGLRTLLDSVVRDSARPIGELEVLDGAELAWLEERGGRLEESAPDGGTTALDLVLAQVRRTPDAVALVSDGRESTYRQMWVRASALADRLRSAGVGAGVPVGVHLPRSADLVVSVLAIWMAGGAYLPVDPDYPRDRTEYVIADSGLRVLVSDRPVDTEALVVRVDEPSGATDGDALPGLAARPAPGDLGYVIYTSGSTGRPKGVLIEHSQFVNFCRAVDRRIEGGSGDTWLAVTSPSFDISTVELIWTLTRGFRVVIAQGSVGEWPTYRSYGPTHLQCTPSLARMLLADADGRALLGGLDRMIVGGEALDRGLARKLLSAVRGGVTNIYGPSECTVWATTWHVEPGGVSLGDAVLNTTLYVLDPAGRRVPRGSVGELFIGGHGVARGYLGRPELTAERFVEDPFTPGGRMYRTGDLVRYREDGSLEYRGRTDFQVKLHGHRIELGEIEAVAADHPDVVECAAVVDRTVPDNPHLTLHWTGSPTPSTDLRAHLARQLPAHMVPPRINHLDTLPHTPNNKIDRNALLTLPTTHDHPNHPGHSVPAADPAGAPGAPGATEAVVAGAWRTVLGIPHIDPDKGFFEIGGNSMTALNAHKIITTELGREFPLSALFQYPTVHRLAAHLDGTGTMKHLEHDTGRPSNRVDRADRTGLDNAVAVVGMACKLPGAPDIDTFWNNLREGVESIRHFTLDELRAAGLPEELITDPDYVPAKGHIEGADLFDAAFFDYSPAEAEVMDPQHRLFLETAWQAVEHAGIVPESFDGRIGVFAGAGIGGYEPESTGDDMTSFYRTMIGGRNDFLSTRLSHKLNLRGPALTVQTACSTGLVATHLARESLLRGESDIALIGGASVTVPLIQGYPYQEGLVVSPDGKCRAFDEKGAGTVGADGVGVVVLRRLSDAIEAGDTVYAVLRGSAINNDGSAKVGFTAPSIEGQARVITQAHTDAGIDPATIGYIEAHGTGTRLGDPIEIQALQQAFGPAHREEPCAIGSVKTNIGHTDATAGIAGLIKTALAVHHGELVPSLNYEHPNPEMGMDPNLFHVNTETRPWHEDGPRRAGVSSFGIGGTNAHIVLEQAPQQSERPERTPDTATSTGGAVPVVVSGRDEAALREQAGRWASWISRGEGVRVADVAVTAARHRSHFESRASVVASDAAGLVEALEALAEGRAHDAVVTGTAERRGKVVFVYPGQGSQWVGMGRELLSSSEVFAQTVNACDAALRPFTGWSVREVLAGEEGDHPPFDRVDVVQPALFAMGVALSALWRSLGVEPGAVVGHSQGEVVAAVVSGALTLEQGAQIVAQRSKAVLACAGQGGMALIERPVAQVEAFLTPYGDALSVAAVNTAGSTIISGKADAIERIVAELQEKEIYARKINVDYASHNAQMDPLLPDLAKSFEDLTPRRADLAFYSTVTGEVSDGTDLDGGYWCRNLREPVRFDRALNRLLDDGHTVFVEISAHPVLSMPLTDGSAERGGIVVGTLARDHGTTAQLLRNLGLLHVQGHTIDWNQALGTNPDTGSLLNLPTYAFQRQSYWSAVTPAARMRRSPDEEAFWQAAGQGEVSQVADLLDVPEELRRNLDGLLPYLAAWQQKLREPSRGASAAGEDNGTLTGRGSAADRFRTRLADLDAGARLDVVVALLREETGTLLGMTADQVPASQSLQQIGLDSLLAVGLRSAISRHTGVGVPSEVLLRSTGCAGVARYVIGRLLPTEDGPDEEVDTSGSPWLRVLKPAGQPRARVFAIAGSGGTTDSHVPLIRHLPEDIELVGLQLPGRDTRTGETPPTDATAVADEVAAALIDRLDVPVVLYGHSQGTWLAWEIAHRLTRVPGRSPLSMVVACGLPPHMEQPPELAKLHSTEEMVDSAEIGGLTTAFRGILPEALLENEEVLTSYVTNLQTDITMAKNHEVLLRSDRRAPLDIPVVAVGASLDPVLPNEVQPGWAELTDGPFTHHTIAGTHAAPIENPEAMVAELLAALRAIDAGAAHTD